jgi:DNA gyrase subunit A
MLWVASSNGFLKRTPLGDYPRKGRATGGVATMQLLPKTTVVGAEVLDANQDALLIAASGRTARVTGDNLPVVARDRKGSTGLKLETSDTLARMVVLPN